jgi:hypothetical protein
VRLWQAMRVLKRVQDLVTQLSSWPMHKSAERGKREAEAQLMSLAEGPPGGGPRGKRGDQAGQGIGLEYNRVGLRLSAEHRTRSRHRVTCESTWSLRPIWPK